MKSKLFVKKSDIKASCDTAFKWHERPGALQRLTPPWQNMKLINHNSGIKKGARVKMVNYFFGLPITLEAEHTGYENGIFFQDTLIKSPFKSWVHSHLFTPEADDSSILEDKIEYSLPWYFPKFMDYLIKNELERIFKYRHDIFTKDIERHAILTKPLTILISGASGLIGSSLIPFFTTGGHKVIKLVRQKADPNKNEVYWNPALGELDLKGIGPIDVVINLNGSPIAKGRWTKKRKKEIIKSRTLSTTLLAEKISTLETKPELFFSASAIGYYGDCPGKEITEKDKPGNLFISEVCKKWEEKTEKASQAGIRTVTGRIGIVLTPGAGALKQMLPVFNSGLGARMSTGDQQMSWISIEDIIGAIWHIIVNKEIQGPVNISAPNPLSNKEFTRILAKVISRPAPFFIPAPLINLIWGKMGKELLLKGTKVKPAKLLATAYNFSHENLEDALKILLGKFSNK